MDIHLVGGTVPKSLTKVFQILWLDCAVHYLHFLLIGFLGERRYPPTRTVLGPGLPRRSALQITRDMSEILLSSRVDSTTD